MIDVKHFRDLVVIPTLNSLDMLSKEAVELLIGTALQESNLTYLKQLGAGPAVGVYQMEPATHLDIWDNYLAFRPETAEKVKVFSLTAGASAQEMAGNLFYATAMARVHYLRVKSPLPTSLNGYADYWKEHYNTFEGAGTVEEFIENFNEGTHGL